MPDYPLCIFVSYVQPVTQQNESRTVQKSISVAKVATMQNINGVHVPVKGATPRVKYPLCFITS